MKRVNWVKDLIKEDGRTWNMRLLQECFNQSDKEAILNIKSLDPLLYDKNITKVDGPWMIMGCDTDLVTNENPGRHFHACLKKEEGGGCVFFDLYDPPMCRRAKALIPGLLKKMNAVKKRF
ncbi:Unknown protein [Striga hermonthica]|uniref:Uncharacterized protein n=1 Tax=Striga hermonthica TaxID=68872 RepID=A0A9N7NPJ2_STRHE|nr:Unknown protein [Striga hermonthica]